jgi:branched-chain amino acid transport system ATP-binding protein
MLKINDLYVNYGGIEAVKGISFDVPKESIITLIGANGAGKSSTVHTICGLVKAKSGSIKFNDYEIISMGTEKIVESGITLAPEGRHIFPNLTVLENIKIGAYLRRDKEEIQKDINWVYDLFPRLKERHWQMAGTLSGGEQQMLCVARALMSRPKLLMLDEPSLGLAPLIVQEIFNIIKIIRDAGVTILLIEQNAHMALNIADVGHVMETGTIAMSGPGKELLDNEHIRKAYLGEDQ